MKWLNYAREVLKPERTAASRPQMILCGLATGFPLLVGLFNNQLPIAIYGALTGYFLTVHDHVGSLRHRFLVATVTFIMLASGFSLGLYLQSRHIEFLIALGFLTYWVGLMGGEGAELERAILFSTFQMIVAAYSSYIGPDKAIHVLSYAFTSYVFVVIATVTHIFLSEKPINPFPGLLELLKKPLASRFELHLHAVTYVGVSLLSAALIDHYQVERGYWTIITVLLVMKPDRKQSLYRSFQRLVGTCGGVVFSVGVIYFVHTPIIVVLLITLSAFFIPWAMKKNYWLVSFLIAIIIILLLELPSIKHGDFHTPLLRLQATAYGSALGVVGVVFSKLLDVLARQIRPVKENDLLS